MALLNIPVPLAIPVSIRVLPALTSSVPPPALRVIARAEVSDAVVAKAPPSKLSAPEAAPRLASLDT
ncbi:hypothetical protein D3C80_2147860 [compost metagenome]